MKRLRCSLLMVLAGFFLLVAGPVPAADFGFGIPDMVEEKVDELDEKVREYRARQPQLDRFSSVGTQRLPDSDTSADFIVSSAIARDEARVYLVGDYNPPGQDQLTLFQLDGEGKTLSSFDLAVTAGGVPVPVEVSQPDTFHQLSVSPEGQVDVLTSIHTDSGPVQILFRHDGEDVRPVLDQRFPTAFVGGGIQGFDTPIVQVSSFSYDDAGNIYTSGDSGVFSISSEPDEETTGTPGSTRWNNKFLNEFKIPEDGMVTHDNTIYLSSLEGSSGSQDTVVVAAIDTEDSSVVSSDTIVHDVGVSGDFNSTTHLLAGEDALYVHYQQDHSGTDALFKYDYDLNPQGSASYKLQGSNHHFRPTVIGDNHLYAGTNRGSVVRFNRSNLSTSLLGGDSITLSDSAVRVNLQGDAGELYVGTNVNAEGAVFAVSSSDLSDTVQLGGRSGNETLPVNNQFARAVWLGGGGNLSGLGGFLGIVAGGNSITWSDGTGQDVEPWVFGSSELGESGWPHEDGNNQRQRRGQQ